MKLTSKFKVLKPYLGKSKFPIWNKMNEGDIILVTIELKNETGGSNGMYVPYIKLYNETQDITGGDSYNSFSNMMDKVKYEEI